MEEYEYNRHKRVIKNRRAETLRQIRLDNENKKNTR